MRKNLKSKVLLTLLAASVFYLPAYANAAETLEITADTPIDSTWFHADVFYDVNYNSYVNAVYHAKSLTDNTITISDSSIFGNYPYILGAYSYIDGNGENLTFLDNSINIGNENAFTADNYIKLYGAYSYIDDEGKNLTLSNNSVNIGNTNKFTVDNEDIEIYGAYSEVENEEGTNIKLTSNSVNIRNENVFTAKDEIEIYGAFSEIDYGDGYNVKISESSVNIGDSNTFNAKYDIDIFGVFSEVDENGELIDFSGNSVNISTGNTFTTDDDIYIRGAYSEVEDKNGTDIKLSSNSINIGNENKFDASSYIYLYGAHSDIDEYGELIDFSGNSVNIGTGNTFTADDSIYIRGAYSDIEDEDGTDINFTGNSVNISTGNAFTADNDIYLYGARSYISYGIGEAITLTNNHVNIGNDNTFTADYDIYLYGARSYIDYDGEDVELSNNIVNIGDGNTFTANGYIEIYGAYSDIDYGDGDNINLSGNTVTIGDGNTFTADYNIYLYGARSYIYYGGSATLSGNIVNINGSEFNEKTYIDGAYSDIDDSGTTTLSGNIVNINAGVFNGETYIDGAYSYTYGNEPVSLTGNKVNISGGEFNNRTYIYAAYAEYPGEATIENNTITVTGNAGGDGHDLSKVSLYGYDYYDENGTASITASNNNLIIDGWSGDVYGIGNFNSIEFKNIAKNEPVLALTESADLEGVDVTVSSFAAGQTFTAGETMTLIDKADNTLAFAEEKFTAQAGVAQQVSGIIKQEEGNDKSIIITVDSIGLSPQTNLVTQTRAATAAFVNQGTDLINDSLDVLGRDGTYGVKTFAAVQGNRSSYDVADDLKINGWSVIAGFGAENEHNGGDFAWGVFYENGSGNYRTYNTFNNEFFRGDGSMVYNGGGIAARYENAKGVYTEGSLRAGMLKNEMDNALRDASGASYGYDSESTYYGAHIGVGQIFEIDENTDLDVYGKFFHTYVEGDTVKIADDVFDFDSITSDRLRVGARVTKQQAKVNTYYGLAYEYEFNGDADMTAQGIRAERQSFGGGSGIAELGFNYQPGTDSPWNFDLNLRGYVGERQGGSFNVQATYTF